MANNSSPTCQNPKCNATETPLWRKGWLLANGSYSRLCNACGIHYKKFHFCPHCNQIYREYEEDEVNNPWIGCDRCNRWVHINCELRHVGRNVVPAEPHVPYFCPSCRDLKVSDPQAFENDPVRVIGRKKKRSRLSTLFSSSSSSPSPSSIASPSSSSSSPNSTKTFITMTQPTDFNSHITTVEKPQYCYRHHHFKPTSTTSLNTPTTKTIDWQLPTARKHSQTNRFSTTKSTTKTKTKTNSNYSGILKKQKRCNAGNKLKQQLFASVTVFHAMEEENHHKLNNDQKIPYYLQQQQHQQQYPNVQSNNINTKENRSHNTSLLSPLQRKPILPSIQTIVSTIEPKYSPITQIKPHSELIPTGENTRVPVTLPSISTLLQNSGNN